MEKEIFKKANFFKQFKILNVQNNEENIENFLIGFLVLLVNIFFIFIDNGELNTKIILILLIFNFFYCNIRNKKLKYICYFWTMFLSKRI